jgi:DNA-binding NarL/FixJ family response regulator
VTVSVVLAEDHLLVREGVRRILEGSDRIELRAVCGDRDELEAAIEREEPDVVVTDIRMPPRHETEGLDVANDLRARGCRQGVLLLSQYADPRYAVSLFRHGSSGRGYLLKERLGDSRQLVAAIDEIAVGGSVVDPAVVEVLVGARIHGEDAPLRALTPRELEILGEVATGKSNAAIARSLVISKRAVEHHIGSIFHKLGLEDETEVSRRVAATLVFLTEARGGSPAPR